MTDVSSLSKSKVVKAKVATKGNVKKSVALEYPYTDPVWPVLSPECSQTVMELLCRLLEPIGRHRASFSAPSKGKRDRKRKREESSTAATKAVPDRRLAFEGTKPDPPGISKHVVVGFNNIVRCLDPVARENLDQASRTEKELENDLKTLKLASIFIDQSSTSELLWSQLPYLAQAARLRDPSYKVNLVPLPRNAASAIGSAVGIPRATIVAVAQTAPESKALLKFVSENVPLIDIPWMANMNNTLDFQPTSVRAHKGPYVREQE